MSKAHRIGVISADARIFRFIASSKSIPGQRTKPLSRWFDTVAGLSDRLQDIGEIVKLVEDAETEPGKRGPYKKKEYKLRHYRTD